MRLTQIIKNLYNQKKDQLFVLREIGAHNRRKPGFIWHALVESFSTMGSSRGFAGLILDPYNYAFVSYAVIDALPNDVRLVAIEKTFRHAKVRMPSQKAKWLHKNYLTIKSRGGPVQVTRDL